METILPDPKLSDIRACVFDAYGTLFDVFSVADGVRKAIGDKADQVTAMWRQKQLEYTWLRSLMQQHVDFWDVTRDGLDYALDAAGHGDPALRDELLQLYLSLKTYPEVRSVLSTLRDNGVPRAILSNGAPKMLDAAAQSADIAALLDAIYSVEDVGVYKPAAQVYQLAVDGMGCRADQICFMSSNAWDVAGAAHFGFRVVWVNRFGQVPERLPGEPVTMVDSLEKLPELLGRAG